MATASRLPRTLDEFLDWEERQPERHEFFDGRIYATAGGTGDHDQIAVDIVAALRSRLRGSNCFVKGGHLKLLPRAGGRSFYPEAMARCGRPVGQGGSVDDPVVIFEGLSRSTAEYDPTKKRRAYRMIPTSQIIAYVSQGRPHVHVLVRDRDGRWGDDDVEGLDATLSLGPLDVGLTLAEIYEDSTVAGAAGSAPPA